MKNGLDWSPQPPKKKSLKLRKLDLIRGKPGTDLVGFVQNRFGLKSRYKRIHRGRFNHCKTYKFCLVNFVNKNVA